MQDETILYHPGTNQFCLLNPVAAFLWERLDSPCTASQLLAAVGESFENVDSAAARKDIEDILQRFTDLAFVQVET
jgi:hypothetical protein